jgi:hypothetical protein
MDVSEYEALLDKLELLKDIQLAKSQIEEGQGISDSVAKATILDRISQ